MAIKPAPATASNDISPEQGNEPGPAARDVVIDLASNELVIAVVGHVGSGTSKMADALHALLSAPSLVGGPYDSVILKASDEIKAWAGKVGEELPAFALKDVQATRRLQELGDLMRGRAKDGAAVARALVQTIRKTRAEKTGAALESGTPVVPDGKRRAYILDAIRNPTEVHLLRHLYQDAFVLIGVVCDEKVRLERITQKYKNAGQDDAKDLMQRDAKAQSRLGQRVTDAFHLADFFVDNTTSQTREDGSGNPDWNVNDYLSRLVKIVNHSEIVRPTIEETAMHHAHSASMRSACLSRQVGAALVDRAGNVISTGANEVPRAGGGVYGEAFATDQIDPAGDHRCAYRPLNDGKEPYCSSTTEQNSLVDKLISGIEELSALDPIRKQALIQEIKASGVGDLLEFSRAVHAEMDALLSASREGTTTVGTRLFVTTFPCHYCARHIVSAGVDEVQFIEPYPKSRALDLHADAIQVRAKDWKPPSVGGSKVLFRPFVGVAPRMYRRAFLKDRELKDSVHGHFLIGQPDWGTAWHLRAAGYADLEAKLASQG